MSDPLPRPIPAFTGYEGLDVKVNVVESATQPFDREALVRTNTYAKVSVGKDPTSSSPTAGALGIAVFVPANETLRVVVDTGQQDGEAFISYTRKS